MTDLFLFTSFFKQRRLKFIVSLLKQTDIMSYYAVAKGRKVGIYKNWDECKAQVYKFSGPIYKKFSSKSEAENFIRSNSDATTSTSIIPIQKKQKFILSPQPGCISSKRQFSSSSDSDDEIISTNHKKQKNHHPLDESQFSIDDDGFTEVYTDGACTSNGKGNAKAGIGVWFYDNCPINVSQPVVGRPTNNMAEIQAVTIAAKKAQENGIEKLKINTDSQFLINCITKWMPKWKKFGWKTSTGKDVINKQELIEMEKSLAPLKISWNHVRGHIGIYGNEMADKLARQGSEKYKQTQL